MKVLKPTTIPFPNNGQFIRGSTATYIEDGILKTAVVNEPRWQDGKLLVEGEATNLCLQSQALNLPPWSGNTSVSLSAELYLGVIPFWEIAKTTSLSSEGESQLLGGLSAGQQVTVTLALLAGTSTACNIGLYSAVPIPRWGQNDITVISGPATVVNGTNDPACIENLSSSVPSVVRVSRTPEADTVISRLYIYPDLTSSTTVGASVKATRVQIVAGAQDGGSYIPTTTAAVTRAADICVGNFSRASTATYIDASGVIQTAAVNVPRIQNNKLLIEPASTNLATWSEMFTTGWSVFNATTSTITTSPTGVNTARQLNETATTASHGTSQIVEVSGIGKTFTASIFAKARTRTNFHFELGQISGGKCVINTNLTTGVQTKVTSGFDGATYGIQFIGNGWYRIWITAKLVSFNGHYVQLTLSTDGVTTNYAGVAGNGIDIFGSQLEESTVVTSYIPTTNTAVTRSADLHTAGIVYSNAVESTASWSSATTYSVGQKVRYNNTIYESLQGTNLNKQPDLNPTWWLDLGADNISACFDGKVGSKTIATDKLRMIIYPGNVVDAVGYLETNAVVVNTSAIDSYGNIAYSNSTGFTESNIENWYDYFFVSPLSDPATQVVHQGIPSLDPGLFVGIEMINPGTVEVGSVLTGYSTTLGKTQYGLKAGIVDYSKKESDEFGNVSIVERPYSKRMQGDVYVSNFDLNKVQRFLYNIRATPVLWMASDNPELAEVSYVYGFYKDFSTTISYPDVSMCNLDIEGLI